MNGDDDRISLLHQMAMAVLKIHLNRQKQRIKIRSNGRSHFHFKGDSLARAIFMIARVYSLAPRVITILEKELGDSNSILLAPLSSNRLNQLNKIGALLTL